MNKEYCALKLVDEISLTISSETMCHFEGDEYSGSTKGVSETDLCTYWCSIHYCIGFCF